MIREDIQWAKEWIQDPEIYNNLQQIDRFIQNVSNAQFISTIDQEVSLDGTTNVEFIPKGSVYLDGYIYGTTASAVTVGDSDDTDGLLASAVLSGKSSFDGSYIINKHTVPQDNTVTVTATSNETVRVVVFYYTPRL